MRLAFILLVIGCLPVSGRGVFAQKLSLTFKNASLPTVFKEIERQSTYNFVYTKEHVALMKPISMTVENADINTVLNIIFKNQNFVFTISGNYIVIKVKLTTPDLLNTHENKESTDEKSLNNPIIVSGTIKDSLGKPMEGVTVKVKKTNTKTVTDKNGYYSIKVDDKKAVLVFSYVGYETVEKSVDDGSMNIAMYQIPKKLDDVIVIGYGTVKKTDLTGSVVKLKPDDMGDNPISSFDQFVQGRAAGVQITQNTGAPGAGMTFLIRGASTITGSSQPLFVIDGYPVDADPNSSNPTAGGDGQTLGATPASNPLASINPNDIESIEILKDASSIAIYGSRGANGVVIITTKKAKGNLDKLNYIARIDQSSLAKKIPVLNMVDYMNYENEAYLNSGMDSVYKSSSLLNPPPNYDYQDLIYRTAISNEHNLTLTGGDEKYKYLLSGNYLNQQGIIANSLFERGSFRINLERKVNDRFKLTTNAYVTPSITKATQQNSTNGFTSGSVVGGALTFPPYYLPFIDNNPSQPNTSIEGNPLTLIQLEKNDTRSTVLVGNLKMEYKIFRDLNLLVTLGANNTSAAKSFFLPSGTFTGSTNNGYAYKGTSNNFNYLSEYSLNYSKTINQKHRINAVLGYTWQNWDSKTSSVAVKNFVSQVLNFENLQLAQSATAQSYHTIWALQSFLGRFTYTYDNRYILNIVGRTDGSTKLADGHKWAFFPSIGGGWNISNEKFYTFSNIVNEVKLRASYGISGNQNVAAGASLQSLGIARSIVNQTVDYGFVTGNLGNKNLKWENTSQFDLGIDFSILSGRISANIDYYRKLTSNLLIQLTLPPSSGYGSYSGNIGKIENSGFDIGLTAQVLPNSSKLRWLVSGNISFNKNKVIDLGGVQLFGQGFTISTSQQSINTALAGYPVGAFYAYKANGIYQNKKDIQNGPYDSYGPQPGDIRFTDISGNDTIDNNDRTIIGSPYPKYTFGITNSFTFKKITFSFLITGVMGVQKVNLNRMKLDNLYTGSYSNVSQDAWNHRWTGEGTSNYYPAPSSINTRNTPGYRNGAPRYWSNFSDFLMEDASFIRLKSITLSYAINTKKYTWLKSLSIFASTTNLFIITKYTGYDPEVSANANAPLTPGIDNGTIPQPKVFSIGVNVGM